MISQPASGVARVVRPALVFLIVLPWLPPLLAHVPVLGSVGGAIDSWFSLHCHRETARTFSLLAVCWRCYGIYFGLGAGALLVRPTLTPFAYRIWVLVAALILLLDVLTEVLHMRPPFGPLRFFSGMLLGWPVGVALVLACRPVDAT
jgi:uncharacterized membrane protein